MELKRELDEWIQLIPEDILEKKTQRAFALLPEEPLHILPSVVLNADGLTLSRLLVVTSQLMCEIRLVGQAAASSFDVIAKDSIRNFRFDLWTQEIKENEVTKDTFEIARIELVHDVGAGMRTALEYAGKRRDSWIRRVTEALPLTGLNRR